MVRKHQVRALKDQPKENGANEIEANYKKKRSKKLSHDLVKFTAYSSNKIKLKI